MDLKEIQDFIRGIAKSGVTEVRIETDELKLTIKTAPKNKGGLPTEATLIQQVPYQTHLSTIPPVQTYSNLQTIPPVHITAETEIKREEPTIGALISTSLMVGSSLFISVSAVI